MEIEKHSVFLFCSPGLSLRSLAFAVLACFLLVGMVASIRGGFRESLSAGWFSPIQEPWVPGYLVSLALAIASYCLRHLQDVQLPLSLLFITPFASLVFLENFAVGGVDCVLAPDLSGERLWVVLSARYPFSASSPSTLVASRSGGSGDCLLLFPFPFPWSLRHSKVNGWELEWAFPSGCSFFQLWGCPASALAGIRGSVLRAHPFVGTVD